jgi:hypothetical protein
MDASTISHGSELPLVYGARPKPAYQPLQVRPLLVVLAKFWTLLMVVAIIFIVSLMGVKVSWRCFWDFCLMFHDCVWLKRIMLLTVKDCFSCTLNFILMTKLL